MELDQDSFIVAKTGLPVDTACSTISIAFFVPPAFLIAACNRKAFFL